MSIEERSEYPDVSTVTNRSWICSKKDIPAVRVGSQWRFKIEDVDEWTQSGRSNFSA
ncbi:excisionase family DNA-binding protein [Acidaminococcus intestini]|nr:excisionase family DNA-binding protein [Acidaminococcus intestini]MBS6986247.1 helix-turn-helix domain-containing protein [Acidaminococcus intestini]MCB5829399.1 helix-turn-helix domain-containing protein [Acidaminococcus intestini]MCB6424699.1 helix-turn-helix domain-containing protein [Acidaminococcus intestini]MCB7083923.1 helix-turn-helix domain-containing protein [Acidaminococcus intestini]